MSADGSVRKFVNDMFRGKDSFQVAAITTGALFVCGGVAYTARALADGSAQKNFYRFLFSAVKNAPGAGLTLILARPSTIYCPFTAD